MSELLGKIDKDLIDLEERLLLELGRLRKLDLSQTYTEIDPNLKSELKHIYSALVDALESTVSTKNLSLKSNEQIWIEDRMRAVRNLLVNKLPSAFLKLSHNEHMRYRPEPHESARHAASREIAILSEQVLLHVRDGQSIAEIIKDRAEFASYDLSRGHAQELAPPDRKIAQTPDEIRRKLAERQAQPSGKATFEARDLTKPRS